MMREKILEVRQLRVYSNLREACINIFELSKTFPVEERYSLTSQLRRSSRSPRASLAEAWRRRLYRDHFVSKIIDAEAELEETRVWLEIAEECGYANAAQIRGMLSQLAITSRQLVRMRLQPEHWIIPRR